METLTNLLERLETIADHLETIKSQKEEEKLLPNYEMEPSVREFDAITAGPLAHFTQISVNIGNDVDQQVKLVRTCFDRVRDIILMAASQKAPSNVDFQNIIKPCLQAVQSVVDFKDSNRSSKEFNHLAAVAESISALGWIGVDSAPSTFVKDMADAGAFYSNRVLKEFKDKDQKHVDWVKAWGSIWTDMQNYVKQYHTTGLTWNPQGKSAPVGMAAPPPPPPPPPAEGDCINSNDADTVAREELFKALNRGSDVTSGLRKVTDNMKTHKNPNLRAGNTVSDISPKGTISNASSKEIKKQTACKELRGNKWCVEYFDNDNSLEIVSEEFKQCVYIYKCSNCTIKVTGKVNSIVVDSCKKVGIVFESIIACLDLINCQSIQAQVTKDLPAVNIDKTDGAQIYLSEVSKEADIVTAKSSSVNILIPKDDDFTEHPIPEQFKSKFDGIKMVTTVTEAI